MIFLIYTILVFLRLLKGMKTSIPDPCPSTMQTPSIVADMCKSSFTKEDDTKSGNYTLDSVVLRIMIQQDKCICRVTIENQIKLVVVGLRKYNGLTSSAPEEAECGLAVDINHIPDRSTGNVIDPIECVNNIEYRTMPLLQNSTLQFKSIIVNGNFTRGYCMLIQRDISSNPVQVLRIDCDAPMTTEQTTEKIKTSDTPQSSPQTPVSERSTTNSSNIYSETTATTTNVKDQSITTNTYTTAGIKRTAYIAIGAGSGVALILLVVILVVCLRGKPTQKAGTNGYVDNLEDESDDKLPDNVLYVPVEEFDITGGNRSTADVDATRSSNTILSLEGDYITVDEDTRISINERLSMEDNYSTVDEDIAKSSTNRLNLDGNYSTVELDEHLERDCSYPENSELDQTKGKQKPTIKPKPKSSCIKSEGNRSFDQNIKHITPPNGSDNVYAIVDKSCKNDPTTNGSKGEVTCQPDQTYAVVDKSRKRKSIPDETNKKKFEIKSGNRV